MTALIALESSDLSDTITFSAHAASMPDVQLNAMSGEQFTLRDLLYSLLLESHNDTAVAIAEHVSGSTEAFADKMNEKAAELGLSSTHFVTPNGLDADEHYTTAKELCLIASYALQNQTFCKDHPHSRPFLFKPNKHQTISRNKSRCLSDKLCRRDRHQDRIYRQCRILFLWCCKKRRYHLNLQRLSLWLYHLIKHINGLTRKNSWTMVLLIINL